MVEEKITRIVGSIKDRKIRGIVQEIIAEPAASIKVKGVKGMGIPLRQSPAAKYYHHSYPRGLIEHITSTASIALALCNSVERIYGGCVNRDLVLAGVVLHDIFKPLTYMEKEGGGYGSSALGERLDHLTLILGELYKKKAPLELLHVIAAHHGRSGPTSPRTIEALIVHVADVADASLNGEVLDAAQSLVKDCTGENVRFSSSKEAFDIIYAKQSQGCKGVEEILNRKKAGSQA